MKDESDIGVRGRKKTKDETKTKAAGKNGKRRRLGGGDVEILPEGEPSLDADSETLSPRRRLARDVEKGTKMARLQDPDIEAKDSDIRLLKVRRCVFTRACLVLAQTGLRGAAAAPPLSLRYMETHEESFYS